MVSSHLCLSSISMQTPKPSAYEHALRLSAATQQHQTAALSADQKHRQGSHLEALKPVLRAIDPMPTAVDITPPDSKGCLREYGVVMLVASDCRRTMADPGMHPEVLRSPASFRFPWFRHQGQGSMGHLMTQDAINADTYRLAGIVPSSVSAIKNPKHQAAFLFLFLFPPPLCNARALARASIIPRRRRKEKGRESVPTERHSQASPWRRTARARGGSPPSRAGWRLDT
ncbi:hypothetical protein V8C34DRAFT_279434 [Trichoderma compactum]